MTTTEPYTVSQAAGLPETVLPDALLATLPVSVAPAPWQTRCEVVTWLHPLDDAALATVPDPIRPAGIALVAWALVRYADTPVGPYSEIAATLIPADGTAYGHIPFIVVDSLPSIVGGRANWLLPKALARFAWGDDGLSVAVSSDQPAAPAWSIDVRYSPSGDATPLTMANHVQQISTEGVVRQFDGEVSGAMRAATIEVDGHADGSLALLLRPGRYDGSVMSDCRFDVGPLNA